jgi:mono/diheme cytochrome c family protein
VTVLRSIVNLVQIVALLAAVATVVGLVAYRGPGAPSGGTTLGAHIYETTCVSCHGPVGEGVVGPAIGGGRARENYPQRRVMLDLVRDGRNRMPSFAGTLTPGEIGAVTDYVRNELGQ